MSVIRDLTAVEWRRSSHSDANGGDCVEFSRSSVSSGVVPVRDSKNPHGPALVVPSTSWGVFVRAVARGQVAS
ncbi:DUF397 domain-containing protein [Streptomyces sp. B6B3]|uniref:DUF397 domain-containing protein n=1 Tax=Streptomyces sp. B6B3 TaxID=3153570 RepID=UPI00325D9110